MDEKPIKREGMKLVHAIPAGAAVQLFHGIKFVAVIAPSNAPPYFLQHDGKIVPIDPSETP